MVIGRAYRDEPILLFALADWGAAMEVRCKGDTRYIGFRKAWLYQFDQALFDQLRAAFEANDREELNRLWGVAENAT
jgi:hypothetical protein